MNKCEQPEVSAHRDGRVGSPQKGRKSLNLGSPRPVRNRHPYIERLPSRPISENDRVMRKRYTFSSLETNALAVEHLRYRGRAHDIRNILTCIFSLVSIELDLGDSHKMDPKKINKLLRIDTLAKELESVTNISSFPLPPKQRKRNNTIMVQKIEEMSQVINSNPVFKPGDTQRMNYQLKIFSDMIKNDSDNASVSEVLGSMGNLCECITIDAKIPKNTQIVFSTNTLFRMLNNLIDNAKKAEASEIRITARIDGEDTCMISVEDNGTGMNEKTAEELVTRNADYSQDRQHGIGLLAVIRSELELYRGGSLEMRTAENAGTEFILKIPLFRTIQE